MKKIGVKKLWHGMAGVHEKYLNLEDDLQITDRSTGEVMVIPKDRIRIAVVSTSKEVFHDKYGKSAPYRIIYFKWEAIKQQTLL